MSTKIEELCKQWFEEVWNKGRAEAIDELLSTEAIAHGLGEGGGDLKGTEGFKAFHAVFTGAFPDLQITVEDIMTSGDKGAVRFCGTATHRGDHLGIKATNRKVSFTGMTFMRWKDGQIVEGWNNVDIAGMMAQIGAE